MKAGMPSYTSIKQDVRSKGSGSSYGKDVFYDEIWKPPKKPLKLSKFLCFVRPRLEKFSQEDLDQRITKLHKCCLTHMQDSYKVHLNRLKGTVLLQRWLQKVGWYKLKVALGLDLLEEILERADFEYLKGLQVMSLVWCTISCVHHFYVRLRSTHSSCDWSRRRQARRSIRIYEVLLTMTLPFLFINVIHAIITFYNESRLWDIEYLCAELLKRVLLISTKREETIHIVLDNTERATTADTKSARQMIRVLYMVLEHFRWYDMDEELLVRFLGMFHKSIMPDPEEPFNYAPLQKGLEVCIRHVLENLPNIYLLNTIKIMLQWSTDVNLSDQAMLEFGNLLEYAAMLHETFIFRNTFRSDIFPLVLQLIGSENRICSLLGNRVMQQLMDRHNNRIQFDTPRIFFDDIHFNITIATYNVDDKLFMKKYREMIHATLLASIELHGVHRINLESTYCSIALFLVEVPCGYTAAAVVCLAMSIQEYTLSDESLELECSHRLHAMVMALMSLVCWVYKAEVFYEYLKIVVARRAQFAPHLNPPLRASYQYAQHHILWNKPELFFEDWEARYGLWKCFRTKGTKTV